LFRWAQADQELDEELRDHIERKTEEYVAKGLAAKEADEIKQLFLSYQASGVSFHQALTKEPWVPEPL